VNLTIHLHVTPSLRKTGAIRGTPLSFMCNCGMQRGGLTLNNDDDDDDDDDDD